MIARIKKVFKNWRADRQHLRELLIKLEALSDPTFLDRALIGDGPHIWLGNMLISGDKKK